MIVSLLGEADALRRLVDLISSTPTLPAVEITVGMAGDIRLHPIAPDGAGRWQVDAWAAALGAPVETLPAVVEAHGLLGSHQVTVWASA